MLFTGHSEHTIDPKQRLAIPARYRNQWNAERDGGAWICIPWPTGHLRLYSEAAFTHMARQGEMSLIPDQVTSELEVSLYGFAERLEMDSTGRITLPREHLEMTGLATDVVVVGAGTRLEVRSKSDWQASAMDRFKSLPDLVQRMQQSRTTQPERSAETPAAPGTKRSNPPRL